MIEVELPNGTVLEFPDGTDPNVMRAVAQRHAASSTGVDVAKSMAVAPAKAAVGMAGAGGDIADLATMARGALNQYLPDWMVQADKAMRIGPFNALTGLLPRSHQLRSAAEQMTGPWYEPQTKLGKIADTATQFAATQGRSLLKPSSLLLTALTTAGTEGAGALSTVGKPEGGEENQWARFAGGAAPSALAAAILGLRSKPGQVVREALGKLTPEQIAAARQLEAEAARLGVPLMGTESLDRGHALASAVADNPASSALLRDFLGQRPGQVKQAAESVLLAPTGPRGTPAANAAAAEKAATEALVAAERGVVEKSGPLYEMAARETVEPELIANLINRAMARSAADETGKLAPAIDQYVAALLGRQRPNYRQLPGTEAPSIISTLDKAVAGQPVSPGRTNVRPPITSGSIQQTIEEAAATLQPHGFGTTVPAASMPIQAQVRPPYLLDVPNLDRLRRWFRTQADIPPIRQDAPTKEVSGAWKALNAELKDIMSRTAPTDVGPGRSKFAEARALHQKLSEQNLDPLLASDVGKIAGKGFDPAVHPAIERGQAVLTSANARPETIRTVHQALNAQDKRAFPGMVQTHLENELASATTDLLSGPATNAGAKLRNALVGNDIKQANFDEMMRGVAHASGADPDALLAGANKLLQVLERTGRTPGAGSPTHGRGEIGKELGKTKTADALNIVSGTPLRSYTQRFTDWVQRGRYVDLAKALTEPGSVDKLVRMAKLEPDGLSARYLASQILGLDRAINEQ